MTTPSKRQAEARERAIMLLMVATKIDHGDAESIIDFIIEAATPEPSDHAAAVGALLQPGERDPRD